LTDLLIAHLVRPRAAALDSETLPAGIGMVITLKFVLSLTANDLLLGLPAFQAAEHVAVVAFGNVDPSDRLAEVVSDFRASTGRGGMLVTTGAIADINANFRLWCGDIGGISTREES
jgi:hypothetical protein